MGNGVTEVAAALASGVTVVDLSLTIAEDLPGNWPTHVPFQQKIFNWFASWPGELSPVSDRGGPYQTRWMLIDDHTGTHFDAPSHFIPPPDSGLPNASAAGLVSGDVVELDQLMGTAAVIDASGLVGQGGPGRSALVTAESVRAWEYEHRRLRSGDVVLIRTDWDRKYLTGAEGAGYAYDVVVSRTAEGWPAPDEDTIELLLERGVRCVGIDAPSIGAVHDPIPVHVRGLGGGAVFIEGLANLAELPATGAYFVFLPVKVRGATGGPGRAIGLRPAASVPGSGGA
jgi:isatin hydrolase